MSRILYDDDDVIGWMQKSLDEANEAKLEGNSLFRDAKYEEALLKYDHALQLASSDLPSAVELRSISHSNRATCFFKLVCLYTILHTYMSIDILHNNLYAPFVLLILLPFVLLILLRSTTTKNNHPLCVCVCVLSVG